MRFQLRRAGTLSESEIPIEGEPLWDDVNRRIGFYNFEDGVLNWFRIPRTGENENYIPEHEWNGTQLRWRNPNGTWGDYEQLIGVSITNIERTENNDGTVTLEFTMSDTQVMSVTVAVRPVHKGPYDNDEEYGALNEVYWRGATYRVKEGTEPPAGTPPSNGLYWDKVASNGLAELPEIFPISGTSLVLGLAHKGSLIRSNSSSDTVITVSPQVDVAWEGREVIYATQFGTGILSIAAGSGVTIVSRGGLLTLSGRYGEVKLVRLEENVWLLSGDLA